MKPWIKRSLIGAATVAVLLLAFFGIERVRGERALNHHLNRLKAMGVVLDVHVLAPKRVGPDRNAFLDFAQLSNRTDSFLTNFMEGPSALNFAEPGILVVAWKAEKWKVDEKTTNSWTQFELKAARAGELLAFLRAAAQKPDYDTGFDYEKGSGD